MRSEVGVVGGQAHDGPRRNPRGDKSDAQKSDPRMGTEVAFSRPWNDIDQLWLLCTEADASAPPSIASQSLMSMAK
jgi:hypothetical protein